jgi:hypothetical protein
MYSEHKNTILEVKVYSPLFGVAGIEVPVIVQAVILVLFYGAP